MASGFNPRLEVDHVWFDGTDLNTFTRSSQVGIRTVAIFGWDSRPDVRDVRELRSGQDGEYAENLYLGGRTITIEGEVYGSSWEDLQARKRALSAVFNPTSAEKLFKVPDPATVSPSGVYAESGMTGYERVSARVIDPIDFAESLDPLCQTWQVIVRASDPRVYSDVLTSSDSGTTGGGTRSVAVDQGGTYSTPTTLQVFGPTGSSWSVAGENLNTSFAGLSLISGEVAEIDTLNRTVRLTTTYERSRLQIPSNAALWMLDETSGTTADNQQGTSARDGTYTGGFTLNQSGFDTGIGAVDLNGSTGYVSVPYNAGIATSAFTFEAWCNADSISSTHTLFDCYNATGHKGFRIAANSSGFSGTIGFQDNTNTTSHPYPLETGAWYQIVLTRYATDRVALYVNGQMIALFLSATSGVYTAPTANGFRFGSTLAGSNFFNGRLAAFSYFNATLNDAEVAELYSQRNDIVEGGDSGYQYLNASVTRWADLGEASETYSLASSGLSDGSKLRVNYRDARI